MKELVLIEVYMQVKTRVQHVKKEAHQYNQKLMEHRMDHQINLFLCIQVKV